MAFVKVEKKYVLPSQFASVKLQFLLHCFANNIKVSTADLNFLTYIAIEGCKASTIDKIIAKKVFKSKQSARNALTKYTKDGILVKQGSERIINDELGIKVDNFIGVDAKFVNLEV